MHSSYYTAGSFDVYAVNYIFKSFKKSKLKMMDEYLLAKKNSNVMKDSAKSLITITFYKKQMWPITSC